MATGSLQVNRDIILATKKQFLKQQKQATPLDAVLALAQMQPRPRSVLNYSNDREGITVIAQISRHEIYDPVTSALHCMYNGADALAFFTDHSIYDDALDDMLLLARAVPDVPVLHKNYCLEEYEIMAARASDASGMFLYASLVDANMLRRLVSMTQRWKMSAVVQVDDETQLETVLGLSPHAIAFGDNLSSNISATVEGILAVRDKLPPYIKITLMQTIRTVNDLVLALQAKVDAVIIDEMLLRNDRIAADVRSILDEARQARLP